MIRTRPWKFRLPWLHPQRAEVLAALALSVRLRQPLAPGFARLAEADPSLQAWKKCLDDGLRSGEPLGAVLYRHRLLDKKSAERLDTAVDPVTEFAAITNDSCTPLRGLFLIRWFPVVLAMTLCLPLVALQVSQVSSFFEQTYLDLGIKLPNLTLMIMDLTRGSTGLLIACTGCVMACIFRFISNLRGIRHIPHCLWEEVHRAEALLVLIAAAQQGSDTPRILYGPLKIFAFLRLSAVRQRRPDWDKHWRTYRILTRWRATGINWRQAAYSPTALGVLQALSMVAENCDHEELKRLEMVVMARLRVGLEPARAQALALLLVGVAVGCVVSVFALILPLVSTIEQLG